MLRTRSTKALSWHHARSGTGWFIAFVAVCLWPFLAQAEEIPAYQVLSCEHDCPAFRDAQLVSDTRPDYPSKYEGRFDVYVEALVDVDYTIATDGTVKNPFVEFLLGPKAFADNAIRAISARTYVPATEDGKPVEENHRVRVLFRIAQAERGAREEVVADYRRAVRLASDQKIAEAISALDEIAARPELNFYERSVTGYALAAIEDQQGDVWAARDAIRIATIEDGTFLDPRIRVSALRLRIALEAKTGEFADAFAWFAILQKRATIEAGDESANLIDKLHSLLDGPSPLGIEARTASSGSPALWQHTLLRRSFEFKQIAGTLDNFALNCARHSIKSAVSTGANWTVPASWRGCVITVFGQPSSKFQFVEFRPESH